MKPFDLIQPQTVDDATTALAEYSPNVGILNGGTDYLVDLKHLNTVPDVIIDVSRLQELKGIEIDKSNLRIGAGVTHSEILADPLIKEHAPAMIDAAHTVGAVQTRNLGTIGGNLVTCVPSMDSGPTLLALDAKLEILGRHGLRQSSLTEFFIGPRKTSLASDELLINIIIPKENLGKPTSFIKFGLRKGQALALVNASSALRVKENKFVDVRIALGAVAPVVFRANKAETCLEGQPISDDIILESANIAVGESKPISDFRASKEYRNDLIEVAVRRTLQVALDEASRRS